MDTESENSQKQFSAILDMTPEEFKPLLSTINLGSLSGLSNMMKMTYNQSNIVRQDLFAKGQELSWPEDILVLYQQVYQILMKLELKVFIIADEIKKRNSVVNQQ